MNASLGLFLALSFSWKLRKKLHCEQETIKLKLRLLWTKLGTAEGIKVAE